MKIFHSLYGNLIGCVFSLNQSPSYRIVLDTDAEQYGGHKRLDHNTQYFSQPEPWNDRPHHTFVCL